VRDGRYDGFPFLGLEYQHLNCPFMRRHLGLKGGQSGVRVSRVIFGSSAAGLVEPGDVLVAVDGHPLENDGTMALTGDGRVPFSYALSLRQLGETCKLTVLRDGVRLERTVPLGGHVALVPSRSYDVKPSYYVHGGLVFVRLTEDFLELWDEWPVRLAWYFEFGAPSAERREVVVLSRILEDEVNRPCHGFDARVVTAVNGTAVSTLRDVKTAIEGNKGPAHELRFEGGAAVYLDAAATGRRSAEILQRYGIPKACSADLQ